MEPDRRNQVGSDEQTVSRVCEETPGYLLPVNFNSLSQTVIAGEVEAALLMEPDRRNQMCCEVFDKIRVGIERFRVKISSRTGSG